MTNLLERYGTFAAKNPEIILGVVLIFTVLTGAQALSLELDTDFERSGPQDISSVINARLLRDTFAEPQTFFILVTLNTEETFPQEIQDIRDPVVMQNLQELETILRELPNVQRIFGPPDLLLQAYGTIPDDQDLIDPVLEQAVGGIISDDYSFALIIIEASIGIDDEKILNFAAEIEDTIRGVGIPGSVALSVTGGPLIQTTIFSLLIQDLVRTVLIAAAVILVVLMIGFRSPIKGIIAVVLLLLTLLWTGGTMNFVDIPLSIVTVMVGSLIIGIGIAFSIHVTNRYGEERRKGRDPHEAAGVALSRVGKAIIGTSATTIVSFLAQAGAGIPMMTDMGIALSLGIFYAMVAALLVLPSLVVLEERIATAFRRMI